MLMYFVWLEESILVQVAKISMDTGDHGGRGGPCWTVDLHDVFRISTWLLVVALASGTCKMVCSKNLDGML